MGYVIQNTGLLPHLSVRKNIELVGRITGKAVSSEILAELLELIGLGADFLSMSPSDLSGGQQQRVGIARALATDPSIVLMDEPFSALDNITRGQLQDDFLNLKHLENKTILLVTHDIQEAFKLGDRIVLLDSGEIQQIGKPIDLLTQPANDTVKGFLAKDQFVLSMQTIRYGNQTMFDYLSDAKIKSSEKLKAMKEFLEIQT